MHRKPFQYTNASYSLHKGSTNNLSDDAKFHPQQNLLMMNLVHEVTTSFTDMITDVIIKTSWLDHTLCKSTPNRYGCAL